MNAPQPLLQRLSPGKRTGVLLGRVVPLLALGVMLEPAMFGAFVGDYAPEKLALTNVFANGFATATLGGLSIFLTGGNDGSGVPGWTDLTVRAAAAGAVQFDYAYSAADTPGYDDAGYLLGDTFVLLADSDGQSGRLVSFPVARGQVFGWRVGTQDNTGEPGVLTLSNFTAPAASAPVPEPGALPFVALGAGLLAALRHKERWRHFGGRS